MTEMLTANNALRRKLMPTRFHHDIPITPMHAYSVAQAHDMAKTYTASNKWAWAHVAQELERYDSADYASRAKRVV